MPVLPDAIAVGPVVAPLRLLTLLAASLLAYHLAARRAVASGLDAAWADRLLFRVLAGAWLGAKAAEVVRSPTSFLASPRLLVSPPVGMAALAGAVAGAALLALPVLRGRRAQLPALLDAAAVPALLGCAVAGLGVGDGRALPLAGAFALAALVLWRLERQAAFPGHRFLGALVLGALAFVFGDLFRPAVGGYGGVSAEQAVALAAGAGAYAAARRGEARGPGSGAAG